MDQYSAGLSLYSLSADHIVTRVLMKKLPFLFLFLPFPLFAQSLTPLEPPSPQNSGRFGNVVAMGALDDDAAAEILIGSRETQTDDGAGRIYILDDNGTVLHSIDAPNPEPDGSFGNALAAGGDIDGDGHRDVFACASNEDPDGIDRAGRLYAFSSATGNLLHTIASPNPEDRGYFCIQAAPVDDLDGDGEEDVLISAASEDGGAGNAGRTYVLSSVTGAVIHTLESPNPESISRFGSALAASDDLNGDNIPDIFVSASGETVEGLTGAGRVYAFSGADGSVLRTFVSPNAPAEDVYFGSGIAAPGDLNADGTPDLWVAELPVNRGDGTNGQVYALSGLDGSLLYTITSPNAQPDGSFGFSLAATPDLTGDGIADVLVGAPEEDADADRDGRSYVFSGADGSEFRTFVSPNAAFISRFGFAVAAPPVTTPPADAYLIVGASTEHSGEFASGRSYLITPGVSSVALEHPEVLASLSLSAAPNPAQGTTALMFDLTTSAHVNLSIYDILGRKVQEVLHQTLSSGAHRVPVSLDAYPSGLYLYHLEAEGVVATGQLVVF